MKTLNSNDFGTKLYERFPPAYREEDARERFALKRYLQSVNEGGFKPIIEETNDLIGLVDYSHTRADILPLLLEHYGLEVFHGIPDEYLRYLVPQMGKIWETKGTVESIEYFTSLVSGIKTITELSYDEKDDPFMKVILEMDYSVGDYIPDAERFKRLLANVIPFYVDYELIYRYFFSELAQLKVKEDTFDKLHETTQESGRLFYKGVKDPSITESVFGEFTFGSTTFNTLQEDLADVCIEVIKYHIDEKARLTPIEESLYKLVTAPLLDIAKSSVHEDISSKVGYATVKNSLFAIADFGKSVFNDCSYDYVRVDYQWSLLNVLENHKVL